MAQQQFSIAYFLDHDGSIHHGACTIATTMGAAGDAQWAQQVVTNGDARPCTCLEGPLVTANPETRDSFIDRVNAGLSDRIGSRIAWDEMVGDFPEADFREDGDVAGAVAWILAEAGA